MVAQTRHQLTLTICLTLAVGALPSGQLSDDYRNRAKRAVVMIKAANDAGAEAFGAGVVVAASPTEVYVATALHLVPGVPSNVTVQFSERPGDWVPARVLDLRDRELDLAIIVASPPQNVDVSTFEGLGAADSSVLTYGSDVFPMGYPGGVAWNVSPRPGTVTDRNTALRVVFESPSVRPGNSGGPLLDSCGRIVGIVGLVTPSSPDDAKAVRIELVLQAVRRWRLPAPLTLKLSGAPCRGTTNAEPPTPPPPTASSSNAVIYAVASNNDLLWYRHDGRDDGTPRWANEGKTVGNGWGFTHLFSGGDGIIYAIRPNGEVLWFRHDGRVDGSYRWAAWEGKVVGVGWDVQHVFSGGGGLIYAVAPNGDLLWNRHEGRDDGSFRWAAPNGKTVGNGWNFKHLFSGGDGIIYAITPSGELLWYRHDGRSDGSYRWSANEGKVVGVGWNVQHAFSGGGGVIYATTANGDLLWNRHDGREDGSFRWALPQGRAVGSGWVFKQIFSGANLN